MTRQRNRIFPLLLLGTTLCAYLNSFQGAFQFDDYNVIVNYGVVHSWPAFLADLSHGIRPLLKATYTLNWTCGAGVAGFHVVNLLLHSGNALLVYLLAVSLFNESAGLSPPTARSGAFVAALLFALHPVQTEAVTYICGRSVSLMAFLYLASLHCYQCGVQRRSIGLLYLASPALFIAAVLAKEVAVTLPAALLLWELCSRELAGVTEILRRQCLHWFLLLVMFFALIFHPRYGELLAFSFDARSVSHNLISQVNGISYLISHLFLLRDLNIDPDLPVLNHWTALLAAKAALMAIALVAAIFSRRSRPWLFFGVGWFFLQLAPTNSIVPRLDIANDRQLYLPMLGISAMVGYGIAQLAEKGRQGQNVAVAVTAAVALVLAVFTAIRNGDYRSEIYLWRSTSLHSPGKARVFNNLGYAYFVAGRYWDARDAYLTALTLRPDFKRAAGNLADAEAAVQGTVAFKLLTGGLPPGNTGRD